MDCRLRSVGAESLLPLTSRGVVRDIAGQVLDDVICLLRDSYEKRIPFSSDSRHRSFQKALGGHYGQPVWKYWMMRRLCRIELYLAEILREVEE